MHKFIVFGAAVLAVAFIVAMGVQLPELVASHFDSSGKPNVIMARAPFVTIMAFAAGVLPVFTWWLQVHQARNDSAGIRNAAYWFSPERRAETRHWISGHAAVFSVVTTLFLCFVYGLVYFANTSSRLLPTAPFLTGLVIYLLFVAAWVVALHVRFRGGPAA